MSKVDLDLTASTMQGLSVWRSDKGVGATTYVRLPRELWREAGPCKCGDCDGTAYWDTLAIPPARYKDQRTFTVHYPDKRVGRSKS